MCPERVPCRICEAMILPATAESNNGLCAQCAKNPAYAEMKVKIAKAKEAGEDLSYSIPDAFRMPADFEPPLLFRRLMEDKVMPHGEELGPELPYFIEWLKPDSLAKYMTDGLEMPDMCNQIVSNLEGCEEYVAFIWGMSGDYFCWDTSHPTQPGEYMICYHSGVEPADYAPTLEFCMLRKMAESSLGANEEQKEEVTEFIDSVRDYVSGDILTKMLAAQSELSAIAYDYLVEKDWIKKHIGPEYLD